jgi:pyruvate kinase
MNTELSKIFARTKILATLGPATSTKDKIKELMEVGLDGVRLNFSHGDYSFYENLFNEIHKACIEEESPLAVLLDLQGPKIRIGQLSEPQFEIQTGEEIEITTDDCLGNKNKVSTSYNALPNDAKIGDKILIDDGLLRLRIINKTRNSVICKIENGGILKPKKGMNLPGMNLSTPSVTKKDFEDLEFAISHRVDYLALSFVRKASDILIIKDWLKERGKDIPIIAKIEMKEAVDNFEEILKVSDGVMVARGDLGVELEPHEVPIVQKNIIRRCNEAGKLVITATQMLESMIYNPIPTRAEASDVANAVWDGTDVVMLSGETSVGKFPVKAVHIMNNIICNAEKSLREYHPIKYDTPSDNKHILFDSMNRGIVSISKQVNAKAIIAYSTGGNTPIGLSKYRPNCCIVAISDNFNTMNKLCLKWGVVSLFQKDIDYKDPIVETTRQLLLDANIVESGDLVIYTAGGPRSEKVRENWVRFETM